MSTSLHGLGFCHVSFTTQKKKNPDLSTIHVAGPYMPMAMRMHACMHIDCIIILNSSDHLGLTARCNSADDYKLLTLVFTATSFKEWLVIIIIIKKIISLIIDHDLFRSAAENPVIVLGKRSSLLSSTEIMTLNKQEKKWKKGIFFVIR